MTGVSTITWIWYIQWGTLRLIEKFRFTSAFESEYFTWDKFQLAITNMSLWNALHYWNIAMFAGNSHRKTRKRRYRLAFVNLQCNSAYYFRKYQSTRWNALRYEEKKKCCESKHENANAQRVVTQILTCDRRSLLSVNVNASIASSSL